jgi:Protein of unknown function (DUF3577)
MTQVQSQAQVPAQSQSAFNLIIEGVGYLNRIRSVSVKKGPAYMACTINAMMGTADSVEYVSIDCRIVGKQANEAIELLLDAVMKRKERVIVGFRASDPKPDIYTYKKDGEDRTVEGLKARLLQLTFAKANGQKINIPLVERPSPTLPPATPGESVDQDQGNAHETADAVAA